ncbi:hypothetical protein [Nocardia salmonicida]|uniref:hypothetical protein n=1 Tax=Nocardia salmonicida TaxID=53431 RepID=UPI002E2AC851|nr:hypothetical protein [Nocardia salmonicida]
MTWYLILAYAIATGAFIAAGAAVILVMSFANALAHSQSRTDGRHTVGAGRGGPP